MNLQQKLLLWLGCVLFSVSNLWPPWTATSRALGGRESFLGFYFVSHDFGWTATRIRPDFSRLILEDAVIVGITLIAVLTMKGHADWQFWAIGRRALSRFGRHQQSAFYYLCLVVGLATVTTPACLSWRQHRLAVQEFDRSVREFEANIPRLARRYPLNAGCRVGAALQSGETFDFVADPTASASNHVGNKTSSVIDLSAGLVPKDASPQYKVIGEEETIPLSSISEMNALLAQMGYPERERGTITARVTGDLDSYGVSDLVLPCSSHPKSEVIFQVSVGNGGEFLGHRPAWFTNAVSRGVNVTVVPVNEKPGLEPPPFRVFSAFWSLPLASILGVVIASTGGAGLIRVWRKVQGGGR